MVSNNCLKIIFGIRFLSLLGSEAQPVNALKYVLFLSHPVLGLLNLGT